MRPPARHRRECRWVRGGGDPRPRRPRVPRCPAPPSLTAGTLCLPPGGVSEENVRVSAPGSVAAVLAHVRTCPWTWVFGSLRHASQSGRDGVGSRPPVLPGASPHTRRRDEGSGGPASHPRLVSAPSPPSELLGASRVSPQVPCPGGSCGEWLPRADRPITHLPWQNVSHPIICPVFHWIFCVFVMELKRSLYILDPSPCSGRGSVHRPFTFLVTTCATHSVISDEGLFFCFFSCRCACGV